MLVFIYHLICEFNVSLDWLMSGRGEIYENRPRKVKGKHNKEIQEIVSVLKSDRKAADNLKGILQNKRAHFILKAVLKLSPEKRDALISLLKN